MTPNQKTKRLRVDLQGFANALSSLELAENETEAILAWSNLVEHFKLASLLLLRVAKAKDSSRGSAWRIENEQKSDRILSYILAARNHLSHPEDDNRNDLMGGEFNESSVSIGRSAIKIGDKAQVQFVNCTVNGEKLDGSVIWNKEKLRHEVIGDVPASIKHRGFYPGVVTKADGTEVPPQ